MQYNINNASVFAPLSKHCVLQHFYGGVMPKSQSNPLIAPVFHEGNLSKASVKFLYPSKIREIR